MQSGGKHDAALPAADDEHIRLIGSGWLILVS
jgi:hypothetical protein